MELTNWHPLNHCFQLISNLAHPWGCCLVKGLKIKMCYYPSFPLIHYCDRLIRQKMCFRHPTFCAQCPSVTCLLIGLNINDSLTYQYEDLCFLVLKALICVSQSGLRSPVALLVASIVALSYCQVGDFCGGNLCISRQSPSEQLDTLLC